MFDPAADHTTLANRICEIGMLTLAAAPLLAWAAAIFAH